MQSYSVEMVLSNDVDIEALNGGFPMSDVIRIQVENAIGPGLDLYMIMIQISKKLGQNSFAISLRMDY